MNLFSQDLLSPGSARGMCIPNTHLGKIQVLLKLFLILMLKRPRKMQIMSQTRLRIILYLLEYCPIKNFVQAKLNKIKIRVAQFYYILNDVGQQFAILTILLNRVKNAFVTERTVCRFITTQRPAQIYMKIFWPELKT